MTVHLVTARIRKHQAIAVDRPTGATPIGTVVPAVGVYAEPIACGTQRAVRPDKQGGGGRREQKMMCAHVNLTHYKLEHDANCIC